MSRKVSAFGKALDGLKAVTPQQRIDLLYLLKELIASDQTTARATTLSTPPKNEARALGTKKKGGRPAGSKNRSKVETPAPEPAPEQ